jgi:hypothetical protein
LAAWTALAVWLTDLFLSDFYLIIGEKPDGAESAEKVEAAAAGSTTLDELKVCVGSRMVRVSS